MNTTFKLLSTGETKSIKKVNTCLKIVIQKHTVRVRYIMLPLV